MQWTFSFTLLIFCHGISIDVEMPTIMFKHDTVAHSDAVPLLLSWGPWLSWFVLEPDQLPHTRHMKLFNISMSCNSDLRLIKMLFCSVLFCSGFFPRLFLPSNLIQCAPQHNFQENNNYYYEIHSQTTCKWPLIKHGVTS